MVYASPSKFQPSISFFVHQVPSDFFEFLFRDWVSSSVVCNFWWWENGVNAKQNCSGHLCYIVF